MKRVVYLLALGAGLASCAGQTDYAKLQQMQANAQAAVAVACAGVQAAAPAAGVVGVPDKVGTVATSACGLAMTTAQALTTALQAAAAASAASAAH